MNLLKSRFHKFDTFVASLRESSKIFYYVHFIEPVCRQAGSRFLIRVKRLAFILVLRQAQHKLRQALESYSHGFYFFRGAHECYAFVCKINCQSNDFPYKSKIPNPRESNIRKFNDPSTEYRKE
jgi:hypothetical protein